MREQEIGRQCHSFLEPNDHPTQQQNRAVIELLSLLSRLLGLGQAAD
jgi:hypothetical protein